MNNPEAQMKFEATRIEVGLDHATHLLQGALGVLVLAAIFFGFLELYNRHIRKR